MKAKFNLFIVAAALQSTVFGAAIYKVDNSDNLNLLTSWSTFPTLIDNPMSIGSNDALYFNEASMKGDKTLALGGNLSVGGLAVDWSTANSPNNVIISAGNTLTLNATTLNGNGAGGAGGAFSAAGILLNRGTGGALTINSNVALGAAQQWVSGRAGGLGFTVNGAVAIGANNLTLNITDAAGVSTVSGSIGGSGKVTKIGAGTLLLPNANALTGSFQLGPDAGAGNSGVVLVGNNGSLGSGSIISRGTQLRSSVAGLTLANPVSVGVGGVRLGGTNDFTLSGIATLDASRTIANHGTATVTLGGIATPAASAVNFDTASGRIIVSGPITGAGGINVSTGNIVLNGTNTYTGTTLVSGGRISGTGTIPTLVTMSGGSIRLAGGATTGSALTFGAGATFTGTPVVTFDTLPVPSNVYDVFNFSGTVTTLANLQSAARGTFANTGSKVTFTAGAANQARTWNGTTGIWDGTGTNANWLEGDNKFYNGDSATFPEPAAAATVTLTGIITATGFAINNTTNAYTFTGGALTGTTGLVKSGAGTATLASGGNSFTGNVIVNGGTLAANAGVAGTNTALGLSSGSRSITVNSTGTLSMGTNNILGDSTQTLAATTKLIINNGGTVTASNFNVLGDVDLNGGLLTATAGASSAYQTYEFNGSTVTVGGSTASTISSTAVSSGGMHIAGTKTLTLNVADVTAGTDLTISASLRNGSNDRGGIGSVLKSGAGTLLLSGSNVYTGETTVSGGSVSVTGAAGLVGPISVAATTSLNVSGAGTLGAGGNYAAAIANSGVLTLGSSAAQTITGIVSGTGSLVKSGTGNLNIDGVQAYTGPTSVTAGKLTVTGQLDAASAVTISGSGVLTGLGFVNGAVTVNPGGAVSVGNATTGELTLGSLTFPTTGTLNVANLDQYGGFTAPLFVDNNLVASGGTGSVTVNLPPVSLAAGTYNLIEVGGTITGNATRYVVGTQPALGGRQAGAIKVLPKFVVYEVTGLNPTWTGLAPGGQQGVWSTAIQTAPKNWKTTVPTDFMTGDGVTFNDDATGTTAVTLAAAVNPSSVLFDNSTLSYTLTGAGGIAGSGPLTKSGTGTLVIGTANGYSGGTVINGGILTLQAGASLGSGTVTVNGARLNLTDPIFGNAIVTNGGTLGGSGFQLNGVISGVGLSIEATGFVKLNAVNTYTGATTVVSGGLEIIGAGQLGAGDYSGAITNPALLRFDTTANQILRGVISGTGQLSKSNTNTLTLNGASSYSGTTTVTAGTIKMGNNNALGAFQAGRPVGQVTVDSGGAIDFNSAAGTYGFTIAGTGVGGTGALTNSGGVVGNNLAQVSNIRLSADASIGGSGNWSLLTNGWNATTLDLDGHTLTKTGANTISFVSATTTAGTVKVSSGTLALGATEGGSGVVGAASAFSLDDTAGVALSMVKTSSLGSLAGGGATGGNVTLANATTLTVGGLNTSTAYGGIISGTAAFTKTGPGTLLLTGANSYSGATLISGGVLDLSTTGQIYTGAYRNVQLTINNGGTLKIKNFGYNVTPGSSASLGGLRDQGESKLIDGGTFEVLGATQSTGSNFSVGANGGTFRYAPAITTDTLTLSGNGNSNIPVAGALTLDAVGNLVIAEIIDGAGSLTKTGGQTLTLSGANAYTGATTVSGGTLAVNGTALPDGTALTVSGGFVNLTNNETVSTLFIGATQKAAGVWGAPGSGAPNTDAIFTGAGRLTVTSGPAAGGYNTWATTNAPGQGAGQDFDNDGVSNGAEYVLGGLATTQDSGKLPKVSTASGNLIFTFKRDQASKTADTSVFIEVGTTLATWPTVYTVGNDNSGSNAGSTPGVTVTNNGDGFDTVTLTVAQAPDTKKFARLKVTVN